MCGRQVCVLAVGVVLNCVPHLPCLCALDVQTAAMSRRGNNAGGAASNEFWAKKAENFNASGISMSGEGKPGVYVPRHKRGGTSMASERDQQPSLRVTNLSQATMEEDLRELFGAFGRVTRVYIVRCALVLDARPTVLPVTLLMFSLLCCVDVFGDGRPRTTSHNSLAALLS